MITNGYGQFQMDKIKALGIEGYFNVILMSEWEGIKNQVLKFFAKIFRNLVYQLMSAYLWGIILI